MHAPLLISHVIAATLWVGGVFMASVIDWPSARKSTPPGVFPFRFVVAHGQRILPAVYSAIVILMVSSVGLVWVSPPTTTTQVVMLGIKAAALVIMTGFTLYGTLVAWPRLQLATHREAFDIYGAYITRAHITLSCGLVGTVVGTVFAHLLP